MATYEYRCQQDGIFEVRFPIGSATGSVRCAVCQCEAARLYSASLLVGTPRSLAAAIDRAGRSAETPDVVTRIPGRRRLVPTMAQYG